MTVGVFNLGKEQTLPLPPQLSKELRLRCFMGNLYGVIVRMGSNLAK